MGFKKFTNSEKILSVSKFSNRFALKKTNDLDDNDVVEPLKENKDNAPIEKD